MKEQQITAMLNKASNHVKEYVSLKGYTTLQLGGLARYLIEIHTIEELQQLLSVIQDNDLPFLILGNGSNILFTDQGYPGIVLVLSSYFHQVFTIENKIYAQAGARVKTVCEIARSHCLSGLEFAYGIPGSVGGAIYMNAGAYGGEMKDVITGALYLDSNGCIHAISFTPDDFGYRHSFFTNRDHVIILVEFTLAPGFYQQIHQRMQHLMKRRIEKQPLDHPSAGSTFKRPEGNYASALIEQCGLKGFRIGGCMVSSKHAGFLINADHASSADFLRLIQTVQDIVFEQSGYQLECEIKIIDSQ